METEWNGPGESITGNQPWPETRPQPARYWCSATYRTRSGKMGLQTFAVIALDMAQAQRFARQQVARLGRTKINLKLSQEA